MKSTFIIIKRVFAKYEGVFSTVIGVSSSLEDARGMVENTDLDFDLDMDDQPYHNSLWLQIEEWQGNSKISTSDKLRHYKRGD